jgi:hypothetical protein
MVEHLIGIVDLHSKHQRYATQYATQLLTVVAEYQGHLGYLVANLGATTGPQAPADRARLARRAVDAELVFNEMFNNPSYLMDGDGPAGLKDPSVWGLAAEVAMGHLEPVVEKGVQWRGGLPTPTLDTVGQFAWAMDHHAAWWLHELVLERAKQG